MKEKSYEYCWSPSLSIIILNLRRVRHINSSSYAQERAGGEIGDSGEKRGLGAYGRRAGRTEGGLEGREKPGNQDGDGGRSVRGPSREHAGNGDRHISTMEPKALWHSNRLDPATREMACHGEIPYAMWWAGGEVGAPRGGQEGWAGRG